MKQNGLWKKWIAVAAVLAIMLTTGLVFGLSAAAGGAIIALDVNPSMEIEINKREEVIAVHALNEEAKVVLGDMDLTDVDLEVAVNAIIGSMVKNGYLSAEQNSILVSINAKNSQKSLSLKEKLSAEINALLGESNIDASVMLQDFEKDGKDADKADKNHISRAKSALITKIVAAGLLDANGVPYTYEVLAQLRVNELKLILESKSMTVEGVDASGTASGAGYISRERALELALSRAGLSQDAVSRLEMEMDFEDDIRAMVYEIEFRSGDQKYEYEIHAKSEEILEEEIKRAEEDDDDESITPPEGCIKRETALEKAYTDAGVEKTAVKRPEIELDLEDGVYVYEIEFKTAEYEYEYTIHALTGAILERESERLGR